MGVKGLDNGRIGVLRRIYGAYYGVTVIVQRAVSSCTRTTLDALVRILKEFQHEFQRVLEVVVCFLRAL